MRTTARVEAMERISMNRRDLRILLAVAAHEGQETDEPFMSIADSLIRVVTTHRDCGACGSPMLTETDR